MSVKEGIVISISVALAPLICSRLTNLNTLVDDQNVDDGEDNEKEAISVREKEIKDEYDEDVLRRDKRKQIHKNNTLT
ncbi:hypothetical protein FQA39_LY07037 [Lamprigera yunnana]|nr:hypothetical protein FQA39_LY07037 [Lamprigera yunnana]